MKVRTSLPRDTAHRVGALCATLVAALVCVAQANAAEALNFPPSDFDILSADNSEVIGHAHYVLAQTSDALILHGESHYSNGEYDIEEDKLSAEGDNSRPALINFRHDFFKADGSPLIAGRLDTETGLGVCVKNAANKMDLQSEQLEIPANTYAGASVLIPIQNFISKGKRAETLTLHVFNCAPGPKLIAVDVKPEAPATWPDYPGELEKVDVKANLGFWTVIIQPFIPKLAAWFDPSEGMMLVGARLQRYYRGPKIILVRKREASVSRGAAPAPSPAP